MLTPGIEYFCAVDDDAALAFFEGRQTHDVPVFRADAFSPGGDLALFGSLLTGRSMDELSAPESLRILATEDRDEFSVLLAAVPDDVTRSLTAASARDLADTARRAQLFTEYAGLPAEAIAAALAGLAAAARRGPGHFYARVLAPRDWTPPRPPWWQRIRPALPIAGLVLAAGLLVAAVVFRPSNGAPAVLPAGALAALSLGALIARGVANRADHVAKVRGGFVLLWVADRALRVALRSAAAQILGMAPAEPRGRVPGRWGHLSVDPSGITVFAGPDEPVRFPAEVIAAVSTVTTRAGSGGFGLRAPTPGIAFTFRTGAGREATWVAPLVDAAGRILHPALAHDVTARVADLLGRPQV